MVEFTLCHTEVGREFDSSVIFAFEVEKLAGVNFNEIIMRLWIFSKKLSVRR